MMEAERRDGLIHLDGREGLGAAWVDGFAERLRGQVADKDGHGLGQGQLSLFLHGFAINL